METSRCGDQQLCRSAGVETTRHVDQQLWRPAGVEDQQAWTPAGVDTSQEAPPGRWEALNVGLCWFMSGSYVGTQL